MADWRDNWKDGKGLGSALGMASGAASLFGSAYSMANPDTDSLEQSVDAQIEAMKQNQQGVQANSLDDVMNQWSSFRLMNTDFNADDYYRGPSNGDIFKNTLSSTVSSAATGAALGPYGAIAGAVVGLGSGLIGGLTGKSKAQKAANEAAANLKAEAERQNAYKQTSFATAAQSLTSKNNRMLASQISAYGGPIGISLNPVDSAIDFMQNEELLASLGEDKTKNNNRRISMPMFAFGGALGGYGGDWSNGLTYIGAGGSHEENPLGGVIVGMSEDGRPDQVEEGEYIWKDQDYVFSKRLEIPEEEYEALGLRKGKKKLTYADGAEILQKESAERPNDPISERGKNAALMSLMQSQEQQRALLAQQEQQEQIEYAMGGGLSRDKDYGSKKKPYPKVKDKDFAGGGRSYPIPTKADAIDALRLAGLHGRSDVKAKVYKKYPELKKALGGYLFWPGGPENPPTYDFEDTMWQDRTLLYDDNAIPFNNVVNNTGTSLLSSMYDANNNEYIAPEYKNKTKVPWNYLDRTTTGLYANPDFDVTLAPLFEYQYPLSSPRAKMIQNLGKSGNTNVAQNYWVEQNPTLTNDYKIDLTKKPNPVTVKDVNKYNRDPLPTSGWQTSLRYLPAIAPAISLGYSLFNKPDYGYADELDAAGNAYAEAVREGGKVTPKFIGDYLAYNPFDRIFYANELGAQQAANRSAIMNAGNANRGAIMAALLGSGYNDNVGLGKLFREGDEYNLAQRQKVAEFNRGTNQYNSTLDMQAQEINANKNERLAATLLENKYKELAMRQAIDNQRGKDISLALTDLFNNIGDIGWEAKQGYWNNALINSRIWGTPNDSMYDIAYGAKGGKLNRKKKKGLTI